METCACPHSSASRAAGVPKGYDEEASGTSEQGEPWGANTKTPCSTAEATFRSSPARARARPRPWPSCGGILAEAFHPEGIIAFTFTEKAAGELKARIERRSADDPRLGPEYLDRLNPMFVGTMHALLHADAPAAHSGDGCVRRAR